MARRPVRDITDRYCGTIGCGRVRDVSAVRRCCHRDDGSRAAAARRRSSPTSSAEQAAVLAGVAKALGDPTRLRIVDAVAQGRSGGHLPVRAAAALRDVAGRPGEAPQGARRRWRSSAPNAAARWTYYYVRPRASAAWPRGWADRTAARRSRGGRPPRVSPPSRSSSPAVAPRSRTRSATARSARSA